MQRWHGDRPRMHACMHGIHVERFNAMRRRIKGDGSLPLFRFINSAASGETLSDEAILAVYLAASAESAVGESELGERCL